MERTTRVLIVDDEKNLCTTLADILQEEGYDVSTAATGEEAVERCGKEVYDVILLDVRMPGIGGEEAFRRIRHHHKAVRVIMMSAYSVEELKRATLDEGAIAFLSKPLNIQSVVNLVGKVKDTDILVVTDDEGTAMSIRNALKEQDYRVTVVPSAPEALELVEQIRFDIVFIDVALVVMSGLELYLAIKKITPTMVVVMIIGVEGELERIAQEAVWQMAYSTLRKPLDPEQVLRLLKQIASQQISGEIRKPASSTA